MLPPVRNGHMSGAMVVRVGRLRARCIELSTRHPLQSPLVRSSYPGGAIGILCCIPESMETGCLAIPHPSRVPRGHGSDVNRGRCPKRATRSSVAALVHRRSIVLSDAERLAGAGSRPPFVRCYAFHVLDTHDACAPRRALSAARSVRRGPRGANVPKECYLVDPASSHMLVSKIKPCMCKYELIQTVKLRMAH